MECVSLSAREGCWLPSHYFFSFTLAQYLPNFVWKDKVIVKKKLLVVFFISFLRGLLYLFRMVQTAHL